VDDAVRELIDELQVLVDRQVGAAADAIEINDSTTLDQVQFRLTEHFGAHRTSPAVEVIVRGHRVGVVTRRSLGLVAGTAGDPPPDQTGVGERLQLAGDSGRYRLLRFGCAYCPEPAYRIFYDERDVPRCPHGRMELSP
jgi:hypothetical protein